jgi:hypothetical protein
MHETKLFFVLIATTALLASGCDRRDATPAAIGGNANGLLDDETTADTDTAADTTPTSTDDLGNLGDDPTPPPIEVVWTDGAETSASAVVSMQFEVRNVSDGTQSGTLRLLCSSVLDRGAALDLGAFELEPGAVQTFSVAAADLPIRSSSVLTQAIVELSRTYMKPGGIAGTTVTVEAPRFYRHDDGFAAVKPFTESQVRDDLGGVLFNAPSAFSSTSTPSEAAAATAVLGQVKNAEGGFDDVSMASAGLALRADDGTIYAYHTGASFGVAEPPDLDDAAMEEVIYE